MEIRSRLTQGHLYLSSTDNLLSLIKTFVPSDRLHLRDYEYDRWLRGTLRHVALVYRSGK